MPEKLSSVAPTSTTDHKSAEELPIGYKRTKVGVIPEDWDRVTIGDVAKVKGGKRLPPGFRLVDSPTSFPYIRVTDMFPGGVAQTEIKYVPKAAFPAIKDYRISSEDIFISVAGTLGIVGVVPAFLSGANLTENADCITNITCNRDYLMYWLMSSSIQKTIESIKTVGAQPKLALQRVAAFEIAVPKTTDEQLAIARVLSDVDGLLEVLEALIAKKRAIKQATMQQLLTGKTRLPGFSGEWEVIQLKTLGEFSKGQGITRSELCEEGVHCVRYGELYTMYSNYVSDLNSQIPDHVTNTALPIANGDLLFAASGETPEEIGVCVAYIGPKTAYAGGDIIVLGTSGQDAVFLGHLLNAPDVVRQKSRMAQGDAVVHIRSVHLGCIEISLPALDEQCAIAEVLFDMDSEITALEQRRDKMRAIKQGMMQQLLTGRIRLPLTDPHSQDDKSHAA
ncbi:restriction endonuclease subunit S [Candidatus Foliamicus sp.]